MRNTALLVIFCISISICYGCASQPETTRPSPNVTVSPLFSTSVYERIAVYVEDRTHLVRNTGSLRQVEDEFMRILIEKGYTLAARSDVDHLIKELNMQSSNLTEEALARKAKMINVSAVLLVSINELSVTEYTPTIEPILDAAFNVRGKRYYAASADISARLVSAELAQIVWISSFTGRYKIDDQRQMYQVLKPTAGIVANGFPNASNNRLQNQK